MQVLLTGTQVAKYPFLVHVLRAYERWEEENYPALATRCGIPATVVQAVWGLGMSTRTPSTLRDCALVVFAYCLNGLRDSSVISLLSANVNISGTEMVARLSRVKGRASSQVPLVRYERSHSERGSPLDLWLRWYHARGRHSCFFGLDGERDPLGSQLTTDALARCLSLLEIQPPPGGKFTSHSLRIGAHTEQVLLGFPLEVRLARFGWAPSSGSEMAATYFDRSISLSPASFWVFGTPGAPRAPVAPSSA